MKNFEIKSKVGIMALRAGFRDHAVYFIVRFREVRDPYPDKSPNLLIYVQGESESKKSCLMLAAKVFKTKRISVQDEGYKGNPAILTIMDGITLVNPRLFNSAELNHLSIFCDKVTETEEEAEIYLVTKELTA